MRGVATSLQIKTAAEDGGIALVETDQVEEVDVAFDGADQIDSAKNLVKGGGGALLRENIVISMAGRVVIMADQTKFVPEITRAVPVEVHPHARRAAARTMTLMGGAPALRTLDRGYPFFTESGNIILDCDFGTIKEPKLLAEKIIRIAGVMEVGLFTRRPDVVYRARADGGFDVME